MGCGNAKAEAPAAKPEANTKNNLHRSSSSRLGTKDSVKTKTVMGKYTMMMGKEDIMGEGTSSICRRGVIITRGNNSAEPAKEVAIKVYKDQAKGGKIKEVTMQKFKRQIAVLKELQEPFKPPADPMLWHEHLQKMKPSRIFMQLLDYSQDADGNPAPDPQDGFLYVVTELAQYSLKDFLALRREQQKPLTAEEVKSVAKAIIVAMAGLHAKEFVHIDMKPENLMMFSGRLKVIDVDGCVRAGTKVSISDSSISFSPCYCAPEWARFLIRENQPNIVASPALDVWSVGMTLCELVTLDALLKPQYANFLRNASSHREAGFLFMEWLSSIKKAPLPKSIERFDSNLAELISKWLCVADQKNRKTCAQCLSNAYINQGEFRLDESQVISSDMVVRDKRNRQEDTSVTKPLHKGTLWKLNANADPNDEKNWIKRDMWIAHNHSLCYFSVKENKRLVLIDGQRLTTGKMAEVYGTAKEFAFEVRTRSETEDQRVDRHMLATESREDFEVWMQNLSKTGQLDVIVTMQLGSELMEQLDAFKLTIRNRRLKVDSEDRSQFEPVFEARLWKLKSDGDPMKEADWFERQFGIAKNGSLVYYSPKEERDLVYYTADDVARAKMAKIPDGQTCRQFCFSIQLPPTINGEVFAPGEFSAQSAALRDKWMNELGKYMKNQ